jgi:hypothetical protein
MRMPGQKTEGPILLSQQNDKVDQPLRNFDVFGGWLLHKKNCERVVA